MENFLKQALWKQFGASIDMLNNAIHLSTDELLQTNKRFFYITYHTLLFLDYYLTIPPDHLPSTLPFTIKEVNELPDEAVDDLLPNKIYSKEELLNYLQAIRERCKTFIAGLTEEKLQQRWVEKPDDMSSGSAKNFSVLEILLYNMRHVQHHTGQLYMLLRQQINDSPRWVGEAK